MTPAIRLLMPRSWVLAPALLTFVLSVNPQFITNVSAKDFNNGCGSGWNEPVVPDTISLACVDFRQACAAHDNCYSRCLPGGATYGQPICALTSDEQKSRRRDKCDASFLKDMQDACNQCDPLRKHICKGIALTYRLAVDLAGGGSFQGRQVSDAYWEFLKSDDARSFDFDTFERDINRVGRQRDLFEANVLTLEIRRGTPHAVFKSKLPLKPSLKPIWPGYQVTESTTYGNVDLTGAAIQGKRIEIELLDTKALDLDRFKLEKSYRSLSK